MTTPNHAYSPAHDAETTALARCMVQFCAGTGDVELDLHDGGRR